MKIDESLWTPQVGETVEIRERGGMSWMSAVIVSRNYDDAVTGFAVLRSGEFTSFVRRDGDWLSLFYDVRPAPKRNQDLDYSAIARDPSKYQIQVGINVIPLHLATREQLLEEIMDFYDLIDPVEERLHQLGRSISDFRDGR